jgi:acetylornithine deacetylase/succinyl-diaminopimelate desuccinylase-like protein
VFVVKTVLTDGVIYRGHCGRLEIRVEVSRISSHCSSPERSDNAIYKIEDILQDVTSLNKNVSNTEIKGLVKILEPKFN